MDLKVSGKYVVAGFNQPVPLLLFVSVTASGNWRGTA